MSLQTMHLKELLDEYERIINTDLRTSMGLQLVQRGSLEFMQADTLSSIVPAIFIDVDPSIRAARALIPNILDVTYNFRFIYVKKININENVLTQKETDMKTIWDKLMDNYYLPDLSLTNGQVFWSLPNEVNYHPVEDQYVGAISADLVAISISLDCVVRTKRG